MAGDGEQCRRKLALNYNHNSVHHSIRLTVTLFDKAELILSEYIRSQINRNLIAGHFSSVRFTQLTKVYEAETSYVQSSCK